LFAHNYYGIIKIIFIQMAQTTQQISPASSPIKHHRWWVIFLWIFSSLILIIIITAFFSGKSYKSQQLSKVASGRNYTKT